MIIFTTNSNNVPLHRPQLKKYFIFVFKHLGPVVLLALADPAVHVGRGPRM